MKELIGKKVLKIEIDKEKQHYLKFTTDSGEFLYFAEGDCCSESWFYGMNGVESLIGQVVKTVEQADLGVVLNYIGRQEETEAYCIKITSTGGHTDIEFRNSSNGYYGGSVVYLGGSNEIIKNYEKSLEFRRTVKNILWKEVVSDYTC